MATILATALADALRKASEAHHAHEATHGPDPDWPTWYADYLISHYTITIADPHVITPDPDRYSVLNLDYACCGDPDHA